MQERFNISVHRSCRLALLQRSIWYAKSQARDQSALRQRIRDIAMSRPRFGYLRVLVMLKREGWQVGKKRVYRLYRLEGLQLRMKVRRRKRIALLRGKVAPATGAGQHWSMDFVHDQMLDGRKFRILTVIDQWSRESVSLEANFRLTGRCVGKALDLAAQQRALPRAITVDNGTEFTSKALDEWAYRRGVKLDYTRPGKPTDNGLIESFNGRLRDEFLNVNEFITMLDVREVEGLAGRLQPLSPAWLTRQPDPERVRHNAVGTTKGSGPPLVQNCPAFGETSIRLENQVANRPRDGVKSTPSISAGNAHKHRGSFGDLRIREVNL